jgi:hypothetical protein
LPISAPAAVAVWSAAGRFLGRDRATELLHQLDHGGLLLWVYVRDQAHEQRAIEILAKNGTEDVHVHDLPGRRDPADNPLTGVELDPFLPDARIYRRHPG